MTIIKTTDTNNHIIDTFDLGEYQSVEYRIQSYSKGYMSTSNVKIIHDGVEIIETQDAESYPVLESQEYTSNTDNYVGNIYVSPKANNTTFNIEANRISANQYGEHLRSGCIILDDQGFGVDLESAKKNLTIRFPNKNEYANSSAYVTANTIGPIQLEESVISNDWKSYGYNDLSIDGNTYRAKSSGQKENFQFQKIETVPGKIYKIEADIQTEFVSDDLVKENSNFSRGSNFLRIGNSILDHSLLNYQATNNLESVNLFFVATSNESFISFGYGERNSILAVTNLSITESIPLYSYEQNSGVLFLKWSSVSDETLLSLGNLGVDITDSGSNIRINDIIIGVQDPNNNLAICLNSGNYCLNGYSNSIELKDNFGVNTINIGDIDKFSYSPNEKDQSQLKEYMDV